MKLALDRGGEGTRLLVLLHGLGTTRQVWQPMLERATRHWNGSWMAPDLRGHGESPSADDYSLDAHAADVAEIVADTGPWSDIVILGHSMGGAVALALASGWFGFAPVQVFGLGIKVAWSAEELAKLHEFANAPARRFATKDEAIARYLKVSGLVGLVQPDSEIAQAGVVVGDGDWRLAAAPATANVGPPPMDALFAAAQCPIHLARGATDTLVTLEQLRAFDSGAVDLADTGHNAMVENPAAVWSWVLSHLHA